jgi:hypothetical protein
MCDMAENLYNLLHCPVENLGGINDTTIINKGVNYKEFSLTRK